MVKYNSSSVFNFRKCSVDEKANRLKLHNPITFTM